MKKIAKYVKNKRGETLIESLVAILIFTMASIAMFSMCKTAANLNSSVKTYTQKLEEQIAIIEKGEAGSGEITDANANAQFHCHAPRESEGTSLPPVDVNISVFKGADKNSLFSFYRK